MRPAEGTCGFGVFMKALEECAFTGKPKRLWEELSLELSPKKQYKILLLLRIII